MIDMQNIDEIWYTQLAIILFNVKEQEDIGLKLLRLLISLRPR